MNTELEYLIQKFLDGETTAKEEQTLKRLLEETGEDEYGEIKTYFGFTRSEKQKDKIPFDFREFTFRVIDNGIPISRKIRLRRVLQIAAVVVILISSGLVFKSSLKINSKEPVSLINNENRDCTVNNEKNKNVVSKRFRQKYPKDFWTQQPPIVCE